MALTLTGEPDKDWLAMRAVLDAGSCSRLKDFAREVRNVRLLERGPQLRPGLAQDGRDFSRYRNALSITRPSFVQEHLVLYHTPEHGAFAMPLLNYIIDA